MRNTSESQTSLPKVAKIVSRLRVGSFFFSIAAFIAAGISTLAYFYFPEFKIAWIFGIAFSFISIICHAGISKLSMLDEKLEKKREEHMPLSWWAMLYTSTLLAVIALCASVMTSLE